MWMRIVANGLDSAVGIRRRSLVGISGPLIRWCRVSGWCRWNNGFGDAWCRCIWCCWSCFSSGSSGFVELRVETKISQLLVVLLAIQLTSFVLRFGVERDELEPERDGGRSLTLFNLLVPAFSPFLSPFNPMLSRSRDSEWSPFARGEGEPCWRMSWKLFRSTAAFGKSFVGNIPRNGFNSL